MENSINNANRFHFFFSHREIRTKDSKSNNIEIMKGSEADDIIKEVFESFKKIY